MIDTMDMSHNPPLVSASEVLSRLNCRCKDTGVSCHPFQLGWYHERVAPSFHLPHRPDTLAVLLVSAPSMFEKLFLPYLHSPLHTQDSMDPLDRCLKHFFGELVSLFPSNHVEAIHDFELSPASRRPRVLVQTAGHVAGAAYYYQREDLDPDPWPKEQSVYGVSVHPTYGGWFAFRGVLIFIEVSASDLTRPHPVDCVPTQEMRVELLEKFNQNWRDWSYRDVVVGGARERYSEQQRLYFGTEPSQRQAILAHLGCC